MGETAAISAGFAAINGAVSALKSAIEVRDQAKVAAAVSEIQSKLLATQTSVFTAHAAQASLIDEVRALKEQIAKIEAWEAETQRYQLTDFGAGTFAYLLKPEAANGEPPHRICANCYQKGQKSILQFADHRHGQDHYDCQSCGKRHAFGVFSPPTSRAVRMSSPIA